MRIEDWTPAGGGDSMRIDITHGRISAIEPMQMPSVGRPDRTVDAAGRLLLPGFVDAHAHVVEAGVEMLRCDMTGCSDADETLRAVAEFAGRNSSDWIIGRGWELAHLPAEVRSLNLIDSLTGAVPAYLNNANGHCAWVNSAALRIAGIDRATPDPAGGVVGRDVHGDPDGMLYESAMNLVADLLPTLSAVEKRAGLRAAESLLHSYGVTAWQEAIVGDYVPTTDVLDTLREGVRSGEVRSRVNGALWWPRGVGEEALDEVLAQRALAGEDPRFRCDAVKIMYDGTASSRTAATIAPYLDAKQPETFFTPAQLSRIVAAADGAGLDVHIHANGDRAVRDAVDAIAQLGPEMRRDRRHQIAHLNLVRDEEIRRMAALGVIAVVQPLWAHCSAKIVDHVLAGLAAGDAGRLYRFGSMAVAGVPLASSSDWPVSTPNPWPAMHTAVHRTAYGAEHEPLVADEGLGLFAALRAATAGGARALRREAEIGSIRAGAAADLVLLDRGWTELEEDIGGAVPDMTMIDGEVVFER
ncbi:amidohydrolase [Microbacterium alcoholitolerans]|uniref:amidohydrolase n=1 Tax=unclassified Microbacterium TaxID=2609290 RepID=UPI003D176044